MWQYSCLLVDSDAVQSMQAKFHLLWWSDSALPGVTGMEAQSVSQETPLLTDPFAAAVKTVYKISIPGLPWRTAWVARRPVLKIAQPC